MSIKLYKPYTLKYLKSKQKVIDKIKLFAFYLLSLKSSRDFYSKIHSIACVLPYEYELIQSKQNRNINFIPIRYIGKDNSDLFKVPKISNTILLNNSAAPTGNHIDVLRLISGYINSDTIIYIPFCYGVNNEYFQAVKNEVRNLNIENNVKFLTDFIEPEEYKQLISSCSIAIFGHIRQQGLGNIISLLSAGVKVFFYKDSITYKYYKQQGLNVYNLEEDFNGIFLFDSNLAEMNNHIMNKLQNYDNYLIDLKAALEKVY